MGTLSQPVRRSGDDAASLPARRLGAVVEAEPVGESGGASASQRRDALFRRSLAAADCLALLVAVAFLAVVMPQAHVRAGVLLILPPAVLVAKLLGLYDRDDTLLHKTTLEEMPRLFHLATLAALVVWLAHGFATDGPFRPAEAIVFWATLTLGLPAARVVARGLCLRVAPPERCLVIGDAGIHRGLHRRVAGRAGVKAVIIGHVDLDETMRAGADPFADRLVRIAHQVIEAGAQRVIVAPRGGMARPCSISYGPCGRWAPESALFRVCSRCWGPQSSSTTFTGSR